MAPDSDVPKKQTVTPTANEKRNESSTDLLQGEWVTVDEEINGATDSDTQERRITITGDDCVISGTRDGRHGTYVGKIKLDETARTFDFNGKGPFGTAPVFKGIYDLDGDTLRMCYAYIEGKAFERPTRLRSYRLPDTLMISLVLRRSSTASRRATPVQAAADIKPVVKDLGSFTLTKGGRTWNVTMPEHFSKAEVAFYQGDPSGLTLNAAWEGHLQINGKDVVRFKGSDRNVFTFQDYTTGMEYRENNYKRTQPSRYLDVTKYLGPGENDFYFYHEQRPDVPMGVVLRLNHDSTDTKTVRLSISVSKDGECRVKLGRSMSDESERPGDGIVPITTVYANSFVGENRIASDEKGSSQFQPIVPQFAKASSMLLYPRAFRLPSVLTMDIIELKDGSVGIQYITPTVNIVVYVESEDGLRAEAKIIAVASSNDNSGQVPRYGDAKQRVKVEKPVNLSQSDELSFKLPLSEQQLGELFTIDAVLRARPGQTDPKPAVAIRNARLLGIRDRTLGMELGVSEGKVVVGQVEPNSLAAMAGINVGDQVVALDGNTLPSLKDSGGLTLAFDFGIKPKVALTILRGAMQKSITMNFE